MTFPDSKFDSIDDYFSEYMKRLSSASETVDRSALLEATAMLAAIYTSGKTLFVCGNGGSAAISDSFVCDHAKLIQTDTNVKPRVISLSSNIPMVTAIANDISYDDIFLYSLQALARPSDLLLIISASGNSANVVRAAQWAKENGIRVIALTGFGGGEAADLADCNINVGADNYGIIEDVFQSVMHTLAQFLRMQYMPADLISQRKF